jgi:hypothetical protein
MHYAVTITLLIYALYTTTEPILHTTLLLFHYKLQGTDAWWQLSTEELLPPTHKEQSSEWDKGTDTMDVWFDSGSSWAGVASGRGNLGYPAGMFAQFVVICIYDSTIVRKRALQVSTSVLLLKARLMSV